MIQKITLDKVLFDKVDPLSKGTLNELSRECLLIPILQSISLINKHIENIQDEIKRNGISFISHIISASLIKTIELLDKVEVEYRQDLKRKCGLVYYNVIREVNQRIPLPYQSKFIQIIKTVIRETSEFFDFDYTEIMKSLQMKRLSDLFSVDERFGPRYIWNGSQKGFQLLLQKIRELKVCNDNEFKKLFECEEELIDLGSENSEYTLQFLVCLKESGLISVKGTRGFYKVLSRRVLNFDTEILKNRSPQRRVDTVKNLICWEKHQELFVPVLKKIVCVCY